MIKHLLPILAAVGLAGCATIANGQLQTINVKTDPPGARCAFDKIEVVTPGLAIIPRGGWKTIDAVCTLDGYKPATARLTRYHSLWVLGDVFTGLIPGLIVDNISGATTYLDPDHLTLKLEPVDGLQH